MNSEKVSILELINALLNYFRKKFVLIVVIFIACIASSVFMYSQKEKLYVSKMRIISKETPFHVSKSILEPIESAFKVKNYPVLTSWFNLDEDSLKTFKAFSIEEIKSTTPYESSKFCLIDISVAGTSKHLFTKIEQPILEFLNSNEYINTLGESKRHNYIAVINESEEQLKKLDSVQSAITKKAIINRKSTRRS